MPEAATYDAKLGLRCRSIWLEELKVRAARTHRRQQDVLDEILAQAFDRGDLLPTKQSSESARSLHST